MNLRWEDADYAFPAAGLDCFLLWAAERGAPSRPARRPS